METQTVKNYETILKRNKFGRFALMAISTYYTAIIIVLYWYKNG